MKDFDAVVLRDTTDWARNTVRLGVRQREGYSSASFLMSDGTWKMVHEGTLAPDHGLILPVGALEAIVTAIEEYQGHTSHAETEAKVLREWLAVERARVDASLGVK